MAIFPKPVCAGNPAPAPAQQYQWLLTPRNGWGLLQIGDKVYAVHECHFEDGDGRTCFCVRLRRHAGEVEYQLCLNRDNDLACDCPDATYRNRQCKHATAVTDAYADLNREQRLADFLVDDGKGGAA